MTSDLRKAWDAEEGGYLHGLLTTHFYGSDFHFYRIEEVRQRPIRRSSDTTRRRLTGDDVDGVRGDRLVGSPGSDTLDRRGATPAQGDLVDHGKHLCFEPTEMSTRTGSAPRTILLHARGDRAWRCPNIAWPVVHIEGPNAPQPHKFSYYPGSTGLEVYFELWFERPPWPAGRSRSSPSCRGKPWRHAVTEFDLQVPERSQSRGSSPRYTTLIRGVLDVVRTSTSEPSEPG